MNSARDPLEKHKSHRNTLLKKRNKKRKRRRKCKCSAFQHYPNGYLHLQMIFSILCDVKLIYCEYFEN